MFERYFEKLNKTSLLQLHTCILDISDIYRYCRDHFSVSDCSPARGVSKFHTNHLRRERERQMVLIHIKNSDENQFLFETTTKDSVDKLVRELVRFCFFFRFIFVFFFKTTRRVGGRVEHEN